MAEAIKVGCARPTGGPVGEKMDAQNQTPQQSLGKEEKVMVTVGKKAPDFTAPVFLKGKFVSVQLSEFLGKWVVLCFYPGDFTFV
jgi:hypothetical protein